MFYHYKYYTHRRMLDVCFRVIRVQWGDATRLKLKISWYLKKGLIPMALTEIITIKKVDYQHYREII